MTAAYRLPGAAYPSTPPFHPDTSYPEYAGQALGNTNHVYAGVRALFHLLGLDETHYGTAAWNPLGAIIQPGDRVVLKPNLLWQCHKHRLDEWEQVITHGSVVRAVADYVLIALAGRGEVWITDGPQRDASWDAIISRTGLRVVCDFYASVSSIPISLLDLRDSFLEVRDDVALGWKSLPGDPAGSTEVNLAQRSRFVGHSVTGRYFGSDYDQAEVNYHHSEGRHEYRIARTVASADVFINLPKMKTHKKVGVTLCLKNLVGVSTGRNWLPHHTDGDPSTGGDQFPAESVKGRSERWGIRRFQQLMLRYPKIVAPLFRIAKKVATPIWGETDQVVRNGNWHGNDTCWRMVHDINRCLLYTDGETFPSPGSPKRYFAVVDGVVGGDGNGPAAPDRYEAGILVAGFSPVAVDCVTTRLMGFDPLKLPMLRNAFDASDLPLAPFEYADIAIGSNRAEWQGQLTELSEDACYRFRPHFGWHGKMEWGVPLR
jgi:uncharacterized protein (DUF362 family)